MSVILTKFSTVMRILKSLFLIGSPALSLLVICCSKKDVSANNSGNVPQIIRLTNHPATDFHPYWSPDGQQIVFESDRNGNYDVFTVRKDGSGLTQLTNTKFSDDHPRWLTANKIIFESNRDGAQKDVFTMNGDGTSQIRLTTSGGLDGAAFASPDGAQFTFISDRDGDFDIYVMNQ